MTNSFRKLTLVKVKIPKIKTLNKDIQIFSKSLGLFNLRDKERSCFRLFVELLKATRKDNPISSDELAYKLNLTRGTVIHHLNKLIDAGMAISRRNKYILRKKDLGSLIDSLNNDINEAFDELRKIAEDIDKKL
ncbi:MAG: ArsR family transcriptional regulator [Nanoarchaeota archaeon]|nr:ArsR family transcriptional regulator [Nanoarchaeota archaeon]